MMELCKSESEEEDLEENENEPNETPKDNGTNNVETIQSIQKTGDISFESDKLYDDLCKLNTELDNNDHFDSNIHKENSANVDLTVCDLIISKVPNNDDELVKGTDVTNTVDENNSRKTLTDNNNEFPNDLSEEGNTSAEMSLVYNDSVEENQTDGNLENEVYKTNDDNMMIHKISQDNVNNEVTVENSELKIPDDSQLISLYYNDTEKQTCTEDVDVDNEIPSTSEMKQPEVVVDEHAFSDDDVNMEDIDKLIENAEIMQGMYLVSL